MASLRVENERGDAVAPEALLTLVGSAAWDVAMRRFFAAVLVDGRDMVVTLPNPVSVGAFESRVSHLERAPFFANLRIAATVDGEPGAIGVTATSHGSAVRYYVAWAP